MENFEVHRQSDGEKPTPPPEKKEEPKKKPASKPKIYDTDIFDAEGLLTKDDLADFFVGSDARLTWALDDKGKGTLTFNHLAPGVTAVYLNNMSQPKKTIVMRVEGRHPKSGKLITRTITFDIEELYKRGEVKKGTTFELIGR